MKGEAKNAIIFGAVIAAGIVAASALFSTLDEEQGTTNFVNEAISMVDKTRFKQAPELVGIAHHLNVAPEALAQEIDGKVVLYDIWTYSCINCIRTLPYITAWDEKYADEGLLIIGIHSPEFEFEKDRGNVEAAVAKYGIDYPVVMDNDMETWKAFENRYWPRKYIADHEGYIRYDHIGEGAYKETEEVIQRLLKERSDALGMQAASQGSLVEIDEFEHTQFRTPELYFGYKFAQYRNQLGSQEGFQPGQTVSYAEPDDVKLHNFYPVGEWTNYNDAMELVGGEGTIKVRYMAKEVNIVTEGDAELELLLNGEPIPPDYAGSDVSGSSLTVSEPDLYNLVSRDSSSTELLEIRVKGEGFKIFTFTFG